MMTERGDYDKAVDEAIEVFKGILLKRAQRPKAQGGFELAAELHAEWLNVRPDHLSGLSGFQAAMAVTVAYHELYMQPKGG